MPGEDLSIGEAARLAGVAVQTLRRWDHAGKLKAVRSSGGQRRYRYREVMALLAGTVFESARGWATASVPPPIADEFHCANRAVFETRLQRMDEEFTTSGVAGAAASLVIAAVGELGNNSFDHNVGAWRDVPGVFFGYDLARGVIILADRGQGLLATLRRVRPDLLTHADALRVGFTEVVTGRAPEKRGNGLKLVRKIAQRGALTVSFWTGDAFLALRPGSDALAITMSDPPVPGTLISLAFTVTR